MREGESFFWDLGAQRKGLWELPESSLNANGLEPALRCSGSVPVWEEMVAPVRFPVMSFTQKHAMFLKINARTVGRSLVLGVISSKLGREMCSLRCPLAINGNCSKEHQQRDSSTCFVRYFFEETLAPRSTQGIAEVSCGGANKEAVAPRGRHGRSRFVFFNPPGNEKWR